MKPSVGFIGLGNVGGKLSASLLRNGFDLTVRDLNREIAEPFLAQGAKWGESPKAMAEQVDIIITCLPSPAACAAVLEGEDGILAGRVCSGTASATTTRTRLVPKSATTNSPFSVMARLAGLLKCAAVPCPSA